MDKQQSGISWPLDAPLGSIDHPPPYEIMQLQTSIRSCEGNHYVVTVINDAAENSGLLSNNRCAQGAFEGRGPVTKETDDIQNGPRSTVFLSSLALWIFFSPTDFCPAFSPSFLVLLFQNQLPRDVGRFVLRGLESLSWEINYKLRSNLYYCQYRVAKDFDMWL